jgi:hypothetical protein
LYHKKAMALSDVDATNFELEQAMLVESMGTSKSRDDGGPRKQRALPSTVSRRHRSSPLSFPETSTVASVAMAPSVAAAASAASAASAPPSTVAAVAVAPESSSVSSWQRSDAEYPAVVQELVMNGFELHRVMHAYDLIGDNFDDLLLFLMSNSTGRI